MREETQALSVLHASNLTELTRKIVSDAMREETQALSVLHASNLTEQTRKIVDSLSVAILSAIRERSEAQMKKLEAISKLAGATVKRAAAVQQNSNQTSNQNRNQTQTLSVVNASNLK